MSVSKPARMEFTFPDSGEVIYLEPNSMAALQLRVQRKYPRPLPPAVKVTVGNITKTEYNYADPDYAVSVQAWERFVQEISAQTLMNIGRKFTLNAEQKKAVATWKKEHPDEFDEDDGDTDLFLENIAIRSEDDMAAWIEFIRSNGQPDEEVIKSMTDGFRDSAKGS